MTEVLVDVRELQKRLKRTADEFRAAPFLSAAGSRIVRWITKNFEDEGTEAKWKKLSPNTIAGRTRGSSKVLNDRGRLKGSFSAEQISDSATSIKVGTNVEYAPFHHYGTQPYTIKPVRKRALAFITANGIQVAKIVHHPGLAARPLIPREATAQRLVREVIEEAVKLRMKRISDGRN